MVRKFKYGRPKKREISKREFWGFLKSVGFGTEKIKQEWRHALAFGNYQGKEAVLKLASTKETGKHTENEYNWNEAVWLTKGKSRKTFVVPKNLAKGFWRDKFYFIAKRMEGESLAEDKDLGGLNKEKIGRVAGVVNEIGKLDFPEECEFVKKSGERGKSGEKLWQSTEEWSLRVEADVDKLLKVVWQSKDKIRESVGHGDFVAKHLYDGDKIGVIDGEHAGLAGPRYYDVAQFYLRLRLDYGVDKLAGRFLKEYGSFLARDEKVSFWQELKPVLIQRFMGILWGAGKDRERLKVLLDSLGAEILNDRIIE